MMQICPRSSGSNCTSIPPEISYIISPEDNYNLELALAPSPGFSDILANGNMDASEWLVEQAIQAAARLASISNWHVVFTPDMTGTEMVVERGRSFDCYIRAG